MNLRLFLKSLGHQHSLSATTIQDTEEKVKKMVDAGVMTEHDSTGMLGEKDKIRNIGDAIEDAKPKYVNNYSVNQVDLLSCRIRGTWSSSF